MKISTRLKADLILLLVAALWGGGFSAQRLASEHLGPFLFNAARLALGALLLLPFALRAGGLRKSQWKLTAAAGTMLFAASAFQQAGVTTTTAGNAGFLTGLYVVFTPMLLSLVWRRRIAPAVWAAAGLSVVGIYLLSTAGRFVPNAGDALVLVGAVFWALHVIIVGRAAESLPVIPFAVGQYGVAAVFNLIIGLILERGQLGGLIPAFGPILYTGIFSIAIGFTLQVMAQRHAPPTDAAIILSTEAVFAALFGFLILSERLTPFQLVGCVFIMGAILLAQVGSPTAAPAESTPPA